MTPDIEARFWAKVRKTDGCWEWTACRSRGGYGHFATTHGQTREAHRFAYELIVGPIPDGLEIDHICHSNSPSCMGGVTCPHRRCVRPDHLEPVTRRINILRGVGSAALFAKRTQCSRGHPYVADNLFVPVSGGRGCRECRKHVEREKYRRQVACDRLGFNASRRAYYAKHRDEIRARRAQKRVA